MAERGARAKWFPSMFYEEHVESVRAGLKAFGYRYAMIKHDQDINEDGTAKKVHFHLVVMSDKREFQYTIAKRLGLDNRFVQAPLATKPNGAVRYLLHLDNPEKPEYKQVDLDTNLAPAELEEVLQKVTEQTEEDKNETLLEDIESLALNQIGYKAFLRTHPSFIYQANSLLKLVALAQSPMWNTCDTETGEILE
ncbi:MAG: hypothetical protein IJY50_09760 [Clostridia bacterium]|nr:hypothetical protein [Clostridia bacterium]